MNCKRVATLLLVLAWCASAACADYRQGEVLVKYKSRTAMAASAVSIAGASVAGSLDQIRTKLVKLPQGMTVEQAVAQIKNDPNVSYVGPNHIVRLCIEPNDEYFYDDFFGIYWQWGLYDADNPDAGIQATDAWDVETGSQDVTIAIVDTGVDSYHEDLWDKIVPGRNCIEGADPDNYEDDNGHGTFVAGVAAAMTNNGLGVAGVSWASMIMPVKVISADGEGTEQDAALGIIWAADHGAKVLNLSFGGYDDVQVEHDAIDYAFSKGCIVVAASGNDNSSSLFYPASYDHCIAVGATNESMQRCSPSDWGSGAGSNYGGYLDVVAPGNNIFSTTINDEWGLGPYTIESGTSAAAPFVSGIAALLLSHYPAWTNSEVADQIEQTATDLQTTGWDEYTGFGLVNAYAALTYAPLQSQTIGSLVNVGSGQNVRVANAVITSGSVMLYDRFYIEQIDRACGICLPFSNPPGGYAEGDLVTVTGMLQTLNGERSIVNSSILKTGQRTPLAPIGISTRAVGGGRKALKQGVTNGVGANNISLLVSVWGRVTAVGWTYFYLDDGAHQLDGSGLTGLKIITDKLARPQVGALVRVTGISSVEQPPRSDVTIPVIRARTQSDITAL
jgi:serine protease